ncbi:MAG: 3-deoxy-manno-octulosonate cytidylyltransferase [Spirochaetaceae bacterium]|jgi:3-deoxy-manno-octulosonate cytidylyltransferase (CMP-KDO synthetase)|nr:3-deoxy-manno-octulosonate cytidylyltransferase [Spirochaetaceae bacterium]
MKIIAVIPARYNSSRFPGKPLADICGKPMIWWVYQQAKKAKGIAEVYVATDDERIQDVCNNEDMNFIMTSNSHPDHISRIHEVSEKIQADYYVCINGDEPLIDTIAILKVLPQEKRYGFYFCGAMRILSDPAETMDTGNIKLVISGDNKCIYMSRLPVPFPKGTLFFHYNKYVGIECFSKDALDFFVSTAMGNNEKIEDIDHLRFLEHGKPLYFTYVDSNSISVDTPKDLEKVRMIIQKKIDTGELSFSY